MAILKNSLVVAVWTAASRGLGFARDLVIANKLGAGTASDAFFVALMLPNLFRRLFGEGAFNVAFVPILARKRGVSDAEALTFANATFSWLLLIVSIVTVAGVLAMPALVALLAGGILSHPEKYELAVALGRICFPYLGLITIAAFLGAVCNTFGKFAAYAMVPALLNLSILLCLFALPGIGTDPAYAAAWAIPLGGVAQALYMVWSARKLGLRLRLQWLPRHGDLKTLLYRLGPAAIGVGVLQLSIIIDTNVASRIGGEAAISYLNYANRFYQLPLALIGIAVATVLLPQLASMLGKGKRREATATFTAALSGCLVLAMGACVGLFVLAPELTLATLQHGEMSVQAAQAISWAMMGFVVGLPAYIVTKVTAPTFFANEDPISPVKAGAAALGVNLALNLVVLFSARAHGLEHIAHVGIALATAVGGYVNAALQWHWLNRQGILHVDRGALARDVSKMLAVAAVLALALVGMKALLPFDVAWGTLPRMAWLAGAVALGLGVFVLAVQASGLLDWKELARSVRTRKKVNLPGGESAEI